MDRITGAMLKDFVADNSLEGLKEQDQFEHFVTYATVQSLFGETFDTADIVLGEFMGLVREQGSAALVATHNERLAAKMDRIVRLHDGILA